MKKRIQKKWAGRAALCLSMVMIAGAVPLQASAAGQTDPSYISYNESVSGKYQSAIETIGRGLLAHESRIDVSQEKISPSDVGNVFFAALAKYPELFYVDRQLSYSTSYSNGQRYVSSFVPAYNQDAATAEAMRKTFYEEADFYLDQVSGELSACDDDFSKAVVLHDELALDAHYELNNTSEYTFMVNKYGLCENYSRVYAYLLSQVGIYSEIIDCDDANHEWVKVRLDGKYYNVDVTWDDPTNDKPGVVRHDNFLLSDSAKKANIKRNYNIDVDYETAYPSDNTYDAYRFHSFGSKFCKVPGETAVYAVDSENFSIVKYNYVRDTSETIAVINDKWYAGSYSYYTEAFAGLAEYGGLLYYNTQNAVFSLDPITKAVTKVADNTDTSGRFFAGIRIRGRKLYGAMTTNVNNGGTEALICVLPEIVHQDPLVNLSSVSSDSVTAGSSVTITGAAEGGSGPYTYTYYYKKSSSTSWQILGIENGTDTTAALKPGSAVPYDIKVVVRDVDGAESTKTFALTVLAGQLVNHSTISTKSVKVGEKVVLKGAASGGTSGYQYAFYYKKSSKTAWTEMQPAFTTKSAAFKPGTATTYDVKVVVRDSNKTTAEKTFTVKVSSDKALTNNATVSVDTVTVGNKVVMKGAAEGGTSLYKYAFYYKKSKNTDWIVIGTAYTTKSAAFRPGTATSYDLKVVVKDDAGTTSTKTFTVKAVK